MRIGEFMRMPVKRPGPEADRTRDLRAAVFSNLDGLFAFHTSAEDAEYLAEELGGGLGGIQETTRAVPPVQVDRASDGMNDSRTKTREDSKTEQE